MDATEMLTTLIASGVDPEQAAGIVASTLGNAAAPVTTPDSPKAKQAKKADPATEFVARLADIEPEDVTSGHLKGGTRYAAVRQGRGKVDVIVGKKASKPELTALADALEAIAETIRP